MRKFLLWDHDGVLVDTERWYFVATRESLAPLGVQLDQPTYLSFMAEGRSCWELAAQHGTPPHRVSIARQERDRRYQELLRTEEIEIDGVLDVLAELAPWYRMAIVSTSKRADFDLIHAARGIRRFFEFVINIEDCVRAKPDPDPYLRALERFRARPEEALAIEDSSRGLAAAKAASLDCAIIRSDFTATQDFRDAWCMIDSVRELPRVLGG